MNVEAHDIRTEEADDRGRLYLGTEYANKRVTVAIVEVETDRPSEDELPQAYRDAAESARDSNRDWAHVSDEVWDSLATLVLRATTTMSEARMKPSSLLRLTPIPSSSHLWHA